MRIDSSGTLIGNPSVLSLLVSIGFLVGRERPAPPHKDLGLGNHGGAGRSRPTLISRKRTFNGNKLGLTA